MIIDTWLVYKFIKKLSTPFEDWPAFELGIIDKRGNVLKKRKTLRTSEEKKAFGIFDLVALNFKKIMTKLPGGATKIASYSAALYLIKEQNYFTDSSMLTEDMSDDDIEEVIEKLIEGFIRAIAEEINTASSGAVAGIGVGPDGEPGIIKNKSPKKLKKDKNNAS